MVSPGRLSPMNAIDSAAPRLTGDGFQLPPLALADAANTLVRRLAFGFAAVAALTTALRLAGSMNLAWTSLEIVRTSALPPLLLASLLLSLAGLAGTWAMTSARRRAAMRDVPGASFGVWRFRLPVKAHGEAFGVGRAARWPQAIVVPALALASVAALRLLAPVAGHEAVPPRLHFLLGGVALVLAFPLLIVERHLAAMPELRLPEAPALRNLVFASLAIWTAACLTEIGIGAGIPSADRVTPLVAAVAGAVAAELTLRAVARCFLPPPQPDAARAATDSLLARLMAPGASGWSVAVPVREQFGIDFARSWALAYVRSALPPVTLAIALTGWLASGVVLVGVDQRAVYERFGAPVRVLHPGLHVMLPWPMGQVRRVEFGPLHETSLSGDAASVPAQRVGAEDRPPADADRLWEQAHPAELDFLIASRGETQRTEQTFQVVSADLRLLYRVGLSDDAAMQAAYRTADPAALLRAEAGRAVSRFFAGETIDGVLGENRERMAETLRTALQQDLDRAGSGIEVAAVVIEAVHPPAGAAEAYHAVQAAQIQAETSIAAERGRAVTVVAQSRQYATDIETRSEAAAAESTGTAQAALTRFDADRAAATAGGESFRVERYLTGLSAALAKTPLTIIDHRIPAANAPVLDLRPPGAAIGPVAGPAPE